MGVPAVARGLSPGRGEMEPWNYAHSPTAAGGHNATATKMSPLYSNFEKPDPGTKFGGKWVSKTIVLVANYVAYMQHSKL